MNQLFYNIFNPKKNVFPEGFVCWRHERAYEYTNMKQARAIEFDYINLLAMLQNTLKRALHKFKFHDESLVCTKISSSDNL